MNIQTTPEGSAPMPVGGPDEGGDEQSMGMKEQGGDNPVIGALKTIRTFVVAQKENGNPKAQEILSAFQAFISALGGGEQAKPQAPQVAQQGKPSMVPAGRGARPMGAAEGSEPIV